MCFYFVLKILTRSKYVYQLIVHFLACQAYWHKYTPQGCGAMAENFISNSWMIRKKPLILG